MLKETKIGLVTGGNKGLGFEICRQLAQAGVKVVLTARNQAKGIAAAKKLQSEKLDVTFHQLDVTDDISINNCATFLEKEFGKLQVLINNAGISSSREGMISMELDEIQKVMNTNYYGTMRVTRSLFPLLLKSKDARVINVSSKMGTFKELLGNYAGYRLSKAGINALTIMFANDFMAHGIKVNAMHPGWVRTDIGGPDAPRTPEEGTDTAIWLATTDGIPTGKFFHDRKIINW